MTPERAPSPRALQAASLNSGGAPTPKTPTSPTSGGSRRPAEQAAASRSALPPDAAVSSSSGSSGGQLSVCVCDGRPSPRRPSSPSAASHCTPRDVRTKSNIAKAHNAKLRNAKLSALCEVRLPDRNAPSIFQCMREQLSHAGTLFLQGGAKNRRPDASRRRRTAPSPLLSAGIRHQTRQDKTDKRSGRGLINGASLGGERPFLRRKRRGVPLRLE